MANGQNILSRKILGETPAGLHGRAICSDQFAMALVTIAWTIAVFLVWPFGNFPLYDDWAYAEVVRTLVDRGEISISDWSATNLISLILWGSVFAFPLGAGYDVLRFSTLLAALVGGLCVFRLLRLWSVPLSLALIATFTVLFNPVSFLFSFAFMTDVPYAAAQSAAILLLLDGLRSRSRAKQACGWLAGIVALLCRQTGFAIPIAYGGTYLATHGLGVKHLSIAALPVAGFLAVQAAYQHWLEASGNAPLMYGAQIESASARLTGSPWELLQNIQETVLVLIRDCGLLMLPVSVLALAASASRASSKRLVGYGIAVGAVAAVLAGLGLLSSGLTDTLIQVRSIGALSAVGILASSLAGGLFTAALVFAAGSTLQAIRRAHGDQIAAQLFCGLALLCLGGVLAFVDTKFDRYLIPIISCGAAFLCLALARGISVPRYALATAGILLMVMTAGSIMRTHNYLAEQRVRSVALRELTLTGVPRGNIDAGWVLNGADNYGRYGDKRDLKTWFKTRDYVIDIAPEPGYRIIHTYRVPIWHPLRTSEIVVQQRDSASN